MVTNQNVILSHCNHGMRLVFVGDATKCPVILRLWDNLKRWRPEAGEG